MLGKQNVYATAQSSEILLGFAKNKRFIIQKPYFCINNKKTQQAIILLREK